MPSAQDAKTGRFKPDPRLRNPKYRERVRRLYVDRGQSLRAVGTALALPLPQVQWVVNDLGVMRKKQSKTDLFRADGARVRMRYVALEWSCDRIAAEYGIERTVVTEYMAEHGLLRTKSEVAQLRILRGDNNRMRIHEHNWQAYQSVEVEGLDYGDYHWYVRRLTAAVLHRYSDVIDPEGKRSNEYHVDHVYSIYRGWWQWSDHALGFVPRKQAMPLTMICHPANLRLIAGKQNAIKGIYCAHDPVKLGKRIMKFERQHGKVFDV